MVNLIKNSVESLIESNNVNCHIKLKIYPYPQNAYFFVIEVTDNGLSPESLKQIFLQGFTTKKKGHGFGLHSGAIAAEELGGELLVESDGIGMGATFKLKLPYQRDSQ